MPKQKTADEQKTNRADRDKRIRDGFAEIWRIEREIERLTDLHLSALKEERTKQWRLLKADTGIARKVASKQYGLYRIAQEAIDSGDQEAMDALREMHGALHEGQMVDWVTALNAADRMEAAVAAREEEEADEDEDEGADNVHALR